MGTENQNDGLNGSANLEAEFNSVYNAMLPGAKDEPVVVEAEEKEEQEPGAVISSENDSPPTTPPDPPANTNEPSVEELKARLEAIQKERDEWVHKYKSDQGRVSAYQRQAKALEDELRAARTKVPGKTAQEVRQLELEKTEEWRALQESDPALARLFKNSVEEAVRQAKQEALGAVEAATKPLYIERETEHERRERERLYELVPNLDEVKASPLYEQWFLAQDDGIKNLGYNAEGTYRIMQLYAADMERHLGGKGGVSPPSPQSQPASNTPPAPTALVEERTRKLQSQGVSQSKVTPPASGADFSESEIFKREYEKNLRRLSR